MRTGESERYIRRVTWIGLIINIVLSAVKFAAGIAGQSQAVVADAVHSLSDTTTDVAVIIGSYYWSRPPDENHQHGHRRFETIVTIFIGVILLGAGVSIAWEAFRTMQQTHKSPPGWIAAGAALLSVICKEILYQWTAIAGRRVKSSALTANAWHHRLDAISSIPVLIAVAGAIIFPEWSFLDHAGAAIVSLLIIQASFGIIWPGFRELTDVSAPKEICETIRVVSLQNRAVLQVHGIRTRYIGMSIQVDLHLVVSGAITVSDGHNIAGAVKRQLLCDIPDVVDVLIHIEPDEAAVPDMECPPPVENS